MRKSAPLGRVCLSETDFERFEAFLQDDTFVVINHDSSQINNLLHAGRGDAGGDVFFQQGKNNGDRQHRQDRHSEDVIPLLVKLA